MNPTKPISRRNLLRQSTAMLGSIVFIPVALKSSSVNAGNASKAMLHYQDSPMDGQMCADCSAFTHPPKSDSDTGITAGTCKIVAGPVNLRGWCMAFSRR